MEGREEGRMRTDDIASGGGGGEPDRLPEREPGAGEPEPGTGQGGAGAGQPEPGVEQGGQGAMPDREPAGGGGWQPQSPDPQGEPHGRAGTGATEGGTPAGGGGAATAERTEGGAAPGSAGTGAVEERGGPGGSATAQPGPSASGGATGGALTDAPTGGTGGVGTGGGEAVDQQPGQGQPDAATADRGAGAGAESAESTPLLSDQDAGDFERRWQDVQVGFVDEPRRCVQEADGLVAEVMQRLADGFAQERKDLEAQWAGGGEPSTEDLRVALQRYRSFFNRLLKTT